MCERLALGFGVLRVVAGNHNVDSAVGQPVNQREAVILIGASGFSYEEAAEICGCAVGTIKSRVARGRVALEALLTDGKLPSRRDSEGNGDRSALDVIMDEVDDLSRDR